MNVTQQQLSEDIATGCLTLVASMSSFYKSIKGVMYSVNYWIYPSGQVFVQTQNLNFGDAKIEEVTGENLEILKCYAKDYFFKS